MAAPRSKSHHIISAESTADITATFALGDSNFAAIMKREDLVVDKSLFIKAIIDDPTKIKVITRPESMGKSFNMSMLRSFFEIPKNPEQDNSVLFNPLEIWQSGERYRAEQGKYPVVFINFRNCRGSTFEDTYKEFQLLVSDLYRVHKDFLYATILKDKKDEQSLYQKIINKKASPILTKIALSCLIKYLNEAHQQQIIVLIQDYNIPTSSSYENHYYPEMVAFMQQVLHSILEDNQTILYQAIIMGRVPEEGIFSGISNLRVYSVLSDEYSPYFGFSDIEVQKLLGPKATPEIFEKVKTLYGGCFVGKLHIFNTSAIAFFISDNRRNTKYTEFKNHSLIRQENTELFHKKMTSMKKTFENLLHREPFSISAKISGNINFTSLDTPDDNVYLSLLVHMGFLSCTTHSDLDPSIRALKIPNKLLHYYFEKELLEPVKSGEAKTERSELAIAPTAVLTPVLVAPSATSPLKRKADEISAYTVIGLNAFGLLAQPASTAEPHVKTTRTALVPAEYSRDGAFSSCPASGAEKTGGKVLTLNDQLFVAVRTGSIGIIPKLLLQGADIETRDYTTNLTPLGVAIVEKNDPTMVKILLENKANPEAITKDFLIIYGCPLHEDTATETKAEFAASSAAPASAALTVLDIPSCTAAPARSMRM